MENQTCSRQCETCGCQDFKKCAKIRYKAENSQGSWQVLRSRHVNFKNGQSKDTKYLLIVRRGPRVHVSHFDVHFNKKRTALYSSRVCLMRLGRSFACVNTPRAHAGCLASFSSITVLRVCFKRVEQIPQTHFGFRGIAER